jgi:ABC-type multidrug transport system fused ATPase/permease subunit
MIIDEGSHEGLIGHTGTYRRLYDLQFEDVETASGTE